MARSGGFSNQQLDVVPSPSFYNWHPVNSSSVNSSSFYRHQVNSSSVRIRRRREGEGKKKRERHSGDFSNWRGGRGRGQEGGEEEGGGGDKRSKRIDEGGMMSSSRGCREEFMFNRATATDKDEKKILLKEKTRSCLSPVREEERPSGWRVCLSEETRMKKPALSLKKEGKGELRLLKRTMTMLEEGKRKVDFRGRESKKETWIEEEGTSLTTTRGDKEVSSPVHNERLRIKHLSSFQRHSCQDSQYLTGDKNGLLSLAPVATSQARGGDGGAGEQVEQLVVQGSRGGGEQRIRRVRVGLIWIQRSTLFSCWKERCRNIHKKLLV